MKRVRAVTIVVSLVAAVLAVVPAGAPAVSTTRAPEHAGETARFATWNMWGNVGHHGSETIGWVWPGFQGEIEAKMPGRYDAIALQEVCYNLGQRVAEIKGMAMEFIHTGPYCDNGAAYGNAVLFHRGWETKVVRWMLPNPENREPRGLIGVALRLSPTWQVMFASTHLSTEFDNRVAQLEFLYQREYHNDSPPGAETVPLWTYGMAVLCGDFNANPTDWEMDTMWYRINAGEPYGRGGPDTHDSAGKIDYMFYWTMNNGAQWSNPTIIPSDNSDHHHYEAILVD